MNNFRLFLIGALLLLISCNSDNPESDKLGFTISITGAVTSDYSGDASYSIDLYPDVPRTRFFLHFGEPETSQLFEFSIITLTKYFSTGVYPTDIVGDGEFFGSYLDGKGMYNEIDYSLQNEVIIEEIDSERIKGSFVFNLNDPVSQELITATGNFNVLGETTTY